MSNLSGHGQLTGVMRSGGGGGGGSEVVINPSGAPIGTMEKISVDGDIYEVRNVPDSASASNGDVLTKTTSGVGWYPPTKELPVYTSSDNNKFLTINDDTLSWETIPKELPAITSSDEGKFLGVSNGAPVWSSGGGGASYDVLAETSSGYYQTNEVVTLNENISDYDFLIFYLKYSNGELFSSSIIDSISFSNSVVRTNVLYSGVGYAYVNYTSDTSITIDALQNVGVYKIVGVKL